MDTFDIQNFHDDTSGKNGFTGNNATAGSGADTAARQERSGRTATEKKATRETNSETLSSICILARLRSPDNRFIARLSFPYACELGCGAQTIVPMLYITIFSMLMCFGPVSVSVSRP